jgi:hypothetical protein
MNEAKCTELCRARALSIFTDHLSSWFDVMTPMCECCGRQRASERHHRQNRSQGGRWTPANILYICMWCHHAITTNPKWARSQGYTVLRGEVCDEIPVRLWHHLEPLLLDDAGTYQVIDKVTHAIDDE